MVQMCQVDIPNLFKEEHKEIEQLHEDKDSLYDMADELIQKSKDSREKYNRELDSLQNIVQEGGLSEDELINLEREIKLTKRKLKKEKEKLEEVETTVVDVDTVHVDTVVYNVEERDTIIYNIELRDTIIYEIINVDSLINHDFNPEDSTALDFLNR